MKRTELYRGNEEEVLCGCAHDFDKDWDTYEVRYFNEGQYDCICDRCGMYYWFRAGKRAQEDANVILTET